MTALIFVNAAGCRELQGIPACSILRWILIRDGEILEVEIN